MHKVLDKCHDRCTMLGVYRPPSRQPKGAWAQHLHSVRRERDLSQTQAFELVYEGLGISRTSRAVYLAIDMGDRQPNPREAEYLASVFGWPPEPARGPLGSTESGGDVASALLVQSRAIEAQTAAISELAAAIRSLLLGSPAGLKEDEPERVRLAELVGTLSSPRPAAPRPAKA